MAIGIRLKNRYIPAVGKLHEESAAIHRLFRAAAARLEKSVVTKMDPGGLLMIRSFIAAA